MTAHRGRKKTPREGPRVFHVLRLENSFPKIVTCHVQPEFFRTVFFLSIPLRVYYLQQVFYRWRRFSYYFINHNSIRIFNRRNFRPVRILYFTRRRGREMMDVKRAQLNLEWNLLICTSVFNTCFVQF